MKTKRYIISTIALGMLSCTTMAGGIGRIVSTGLASRVAEVMINPAGNAGMTNGYSDPGQLKIQTTNVVLRRICDEVNLKEDVVFRGTNSPKLRSIPYGSTERGNITIDRSLITNKISNIVESHIIGVDFR